MKTEDEVIREVIGNKPIESYSVSTSEGKELRRVSRDGEYIIQYKARVNVTFSREVWSWGDYVTSQHYYVWLDLPIEEDNYQ